MKIGVDLYNFDPSYSGGVGTFALGITNGILARMSSADELVLIVSKRNEADVKKQFKGSSVKYLSISVTEWGRYINRLLWLLSSATRIFKLRGWYDRFIRKNICKQIDDAVDVLVAPLSLFSFYGFKSPSILCIHDIQQEFYPELFSLNQRMLRWSSYRLSCWKAGAIQVSSNYIKECILEKYNFVEAGDFFIAPEGVDLELFSVDNPCVRPAGLNAIQEAPFIFYPAQLWPHKNHALLIKALSIYRDQFGVELNCVLTGTDYGFWASIEQDIKKYDLKHVYYLGRVDFTELLWLYRNCASVLALGYHESSSLPVREGAVFGRPIICADIPPNRETSNQLYIKLVNKDDAQGLADSISEVFSEGSDVVNKSGQNVLRVQNLSWSRIADEYIFKLKDLANRCVA